MDLKKYKSKVKGVKILKKSIPYYGTKVEKGPEDYWYMHNRGRVAFLFSISTIVWHAVG